MYDQLVDGEEDGIDSSDVNEDSEETDEEENNIESEIFVLDEQRRISLDEFHYFDHPKIGLLVGVYSYPKKDD